MTKNAPKFKLTSSDSSNTFPESPTVKIFNDYINSEKYFKHAQMEVFLSDRCHPPEGIFCASGSVDRARSAFRSFSCTSSHGTRVYRSGAGTAFGSPLGPKILTSARAVFNAQIHLFRRFATKMNKWNDPLIPPHGEGSVPFKGPCCQLLLYLISAVKAIFSWLGKS